MGEGILMTMNPFNIDIPESVLIDLRKRLENVRWPDAISGSDWDYGSNLNYLKELIDYWITQFDWRQHCHEVPTDRHCGCGLHV